MLMLGCKGLNSPSLYSVWQATDPLCFPFPGAKHDDWSIMEKFANHT